MWAAVGLPKTIEGQANHQVATTSLFFVFVFFGLFFDKKKNNKSPKKGKTHEKLRHLYDFETQDQTRPRKRFSTTIFFFF